MHFKSIHAKTLIEQSIYVFLNTPKKARLFEKQAGIRIFNQSKREAYFCQVRFLWRLAFKRFLRLCLFIWRRRFFLRLPMWCQVWIESFV